MTVDLRVEEPYRSDVGYQIARISPGTAKKLGLEPSDIISIKGRRTTYARPMTTSSMDTDESIIRIESAIRNNAQTNLYEIVTVSKATATPATEVEVSIANSPLLMFAMNFKPHFAQAFNDKILTNDDVIPVNIGFGQYLQLKVESVNPKGPVQFTPNTKLNVRGMGQAQKQAEVKREQAFERISYEDVGGLHEPIRKIREMIELPLRHPELFERLGITPPKGVLIYGPPGTGKTLLAKAVANETSSNFILINGPEIVSKYYGESENKLRELFEEAQQKAPTIIFIDEIDSIAPKRSETQGDTERRIVAQLLTLMDGLESRGHVVVIGATNRPDSIDEALRRGGRFDREIELGIPDRVARHEILQIHTRGMPLTPDVNLKTLADKLHGYVGADISTLAKEAALSALQRIMPKLDLTKTDPLSPETLKSLNITMADFEKAIQEVIPSAMREVYTEKPNVEWNDIGGLQEIKDELKRSVEWPIKYPEVFEAMKKKPAKGVLLYGPPGTGKTMLAKAIANRVEANFISIKGPELFNKYVGESERGVREIFRRARAAAPCVIFFDEIDSLASVRGMDDSTGVSQRVVSQLLSEIDGITELRGVFVLAATNRPDIIDPALRRPGRFDKVIEVPMPDEQSRKEIFDAHLRGVKLASSVSVPDLAKLTEGYTGAEIAAIVDQARMRAIQEFIELSTQAGNYDKTALSNMVITQAHIDEVMSKIAPSVKEYSLKPPATSGLDYT